LSRFVTVQTRLRDLSLVRRLLDEREVRYTESEERSRRVLTIDRGSSPLTLVENDSGCLEAKGYEEQVAEHRDFLKTLQRDYAHRKVVELAKAAGFSITSERTTVRNEILLEVTKW
jgi:hypothetical protein